MKKLKLIQLLVIINVSLTFAQSPKNIIYLIGDGMGINYVGYNLLANKGSNFYRFDDIGLVITVSADKLVTDSAAGATALFSGVKTNNGMINITPDGNELKTLSEYALSLGKKCGIISSSSITHATPAGVYAKVKSRSEEYLIAEQFSESNIDFAVGGGRNFFLTESEGGKREDDKNLIKSLSQKGYSYFSDFTELSNNNSSGKIIGLFGDVFLPKANERDYGLDDIFHKAVKNLDNENGFILMVEGSQIDWAGHQNDSLYLFGEMEDFDKLVGAALDFAEKDGNTLVVVTADHETGGGILIGGKPDFTDFQFKFSITSHSASLVGLFAYGPQSDKFSGILDNTEIMKRLKEIMPK